MSQMNFWAVLGVFLAVFWCIFGWFLTILGLFLVVLSSLIPFFPLFPGVSPGHLRAEVALGPGGSGGLRRARGAPHGLAQPQGGLREMHPALAHIGGMGGSMGGIYGGL